MRARLTIVTVLALAVGAACQGNVFSLKVGDCFNGAGEGTVTDVEVVPCAEPHDFEVYAVLTYTAGGDAFPGEAVLGAFANEQCAATFEPYVGTAATASELGILHLTPTSESWAAGDRVVDCMLYLEGQKLTGSMRGSGR